ncbi:MAG: hypothetical protein J6B69_05850 [Lachnospiraceae bacterium]|nr:hypothetical protein [Lachnospiraceae bacterium]
MGNARAVPDCGECQSCAGTRVMPELCRIMGNARAVPDHGECPSCAGSWRMPIAVPDHGK